tara:strand:+ start:169 stop:561 length:393 start_codon:yes stop_codon:yes gene_type:complete
MADTVSTQTISDTAGVKYVVKLTNISDGSGETLIKKVDASELTFMSEDGERSVARVYYSINTSDSKSGVEIIWDGATNATALFLSGQGTIDLRTDGNSFKNNATTPTGDVLLSTRNFAVGDNYSIIVEFR